MCSACIFFSSLKILTRGVENSFGMSNDSMKDIAFAFLLSDVIRITLIFKLFASTAYKYSKTQVCERESTQMSRRLVICEINESYLKNVKEQMEKQKMPVPKDDSSITIAHKPLSDIDTRELCDCDVCKKIKSSIPV